MNQNTKTSLLYLCVPPLVAFHQQRFELGCAWYSVGLCSVLNHHRKDYRSRDRGQHVCFILDHVALVFAMFMNVKTLWSSGLYLFAALYIEMCLSALSAVNLSRRMFLIRGVRFEPLLSLVHCVGGVTNLLILHITH